MKSQLLLDGEDSPSVAPTVQAHLGHQPPQSRGVVLDHEPCRLRDGCMLLAHGTVCAELCWARLTER